MLLRVNSQGQLDDTTTTNRTSPVIVTCLHSTKLIAAGAWSTCALGIFGGIQCWGHGTEGQSGNGATSDSSTPVENYGFPAA
ncbi:MAG: hypothetical protein ACPGWS_00415 [Solirubrobacterales bacterium]